MDRFGVRQLYATTPGGREWYLPADAQVRGATWYPEADDVVALGGGAFHTDGASGEVRLQVKSPPAAAWWRNVEMTAYLRATGPTAGSTQPPHFELLARGERHSSTAVTGDQVNDGVAAPPGTATWPGYPYGAQSINVHCLGTAYHGNVYLDGTVALEKEISHIDGYGASQRGRTQVAALDGLGGRWFGMKLVVRNASSPQRVRVELWLDPDASGSFALVAAYEDVPGSWSARTDTVDGCTQAPFGYAVDQLITWAGPWVVFRGDSVGVDFRWLSVREIDPID